MPFSRLAQALANTKQAISSPNRGTMASAIGRYVVGILDSLSSSWLADTLSTGFDELGSSSSPTVLKSIGFFMPNAGTTYSSLEICVL
jgi:hypothetical protein